MREIKVDNNLEGKRLDKFLGSYFTECSMGFLFKMLRKKNITLNGKKATGKEMLNSGDVIAVFFSDETFDKFVNKHAKDLNSAQSTSTNEYEKAFEKYKNIQIIYEDEHVLLLNKPAGILSQKAESTDMSINEWLIGYLLKTGFVTRQTLGLFRPSVCNRLDRNTSGLLICSKSLAGARTMAEILKDRSLHKYYRTIVVGEVLSNAHIDGYLYKDEKSNTVTLYDSIPEDIKAENKSYSKIETSYEILRSGKIFINNENIKLTELEVLLHTGKTHQIRAHLSSIGHALIGDTKYGDAFVNKEMKKLFKLNYQLLHSYRLKFPKLEGELLGLSEKSFIADTPVVYNNIADSVFDKS
ncbi:RluA family pseudouridine synthase [Butyrivibrio sp. AE3004]|uniref:RluA family pseudouridine synthase n=1 Tax=Butyrivibrio sp. AE3004 TaxID=1506994 RepID=UPI000494C5C2|nr:RluA family pseudouridine synthase [Butyrivibrio sp. AE3004]